VTLDGIPDKPEKLTMEVAMSDKVEISWETPKILRGLIQEYRIDVFPRFDREKDDSFCVKEARHEKEYDVITAGHNTKIWLEGLSPFSHYDVTVRAKTRHTEIGHPSDTLTFATPTGKPNKPIIKKTFQSRGGELVSFKFRFLNFSYFQQQRARLSML